MNETSRPPVDPPPLAAYLGPYRDRLLAERPRKVTMERLFVLWQETMPAHVASYHVADSILAALRSLADDGVLRIPPNTKAKPWSRRYRVDFPLHVTVVPPKVERTGAALGTVWHPLLDALVAQGFPASRTPAVLAINEWLKTTARETRPHAPLRVRSYEILGDEKALEKIVGDRMNQVVFEEGPVTFADLCCYDAAPPVPMVGTAGADGRPNLIVSKNDAYETVRAWNAVTAHYGNVFWGQGNAVLKAARFVVQAVDDEPLEYLCDLDEGSLTVLDNLNDRLRLLKVAPAVFSPWLMTIVLEKAKIDLRPGEDEDDRPNWLEGHPVGTWPAVRTALAQGRRIPCEIVDPSDLRKIRW